MLKYMSTAKQIDITKHNRKQITQRNAVSHHQFRIQFQVQKFKIKFKFGFKVQTMGKFKFEIQIQIQVQNHLSKKLNNKKPGPSQPARHVIRVGARPIG